MTSHKAPGWKSFDAKNSALQSPTGWWIKACPRKTEAAWFKVDCGPDANNIIETHVWHQGDPTDFQILVGHPYNRIYVHGYSGENDKNTYFGVCYGSQVCCKHYDFDNDEAHGGEDHDVSATDADEWKCE